MRHRLNLSANLATTVPGCWGVESAHEKLIHVKAFFLGNNSPPSVFLRWQRVRSDWDLTGGPVWRLWMLGKSEVTPDFNAVIPKTTREVLSRASSPEISAKENCD
jgi:hypothetical protein